MKKNATVKIAIMLGIRRGELDVIMRVNLPAESFMEVEKRDSISPYIIRRDPQEIRTP